MTRMMILVTALILVTGAAPAAEFESATLTVPASSILQSGELSGKYHAITEPVTIDGYMNHFTVDSDFGQFSVTGDLALKALLHEIDAIAELKGITAGEAGTDAAVAAVADTGKSVVNLVNNPTETAVGMSAGVSRFFKRTARKAKDVTEEASETVSESTSDKDQDDDPDSAGEEGEDADQGTKVAYSYLGVGKAQRELARDLDVDPYSENAVLQAELNRVAKISGSVGKLTKILIPIPAAVGMAANVNNLVWSLSPTDLLIQNEEKLEALGYRKKLIHAFFDNKVFTPTRQTALVEALGTLDKVKGREVLLDIAISAQTRTEGQFVVRSILFAQLFHQGVEPITEFMSVPDMVVPAAITASGDGLIIAPVDQFLWTQEIATALHRLSGVIEDHGASDDHLMWVEGRVSDLAMARLNALGWEMSRESFDALGSSASK